MRIDGRAVAADGTWPGLAPTTEPIHGRTFELTLQPAEAAVVTLHGDDAADAAR